MRICWIAALVLAYPAGAAHAADIQFERDWQAASNGPSRIVGPYQARLQAYFDTHPGYVDCDAQLEAGTGVRMLLRFDAAGQFQTVGEVKNPDVERCLANFFRANQPPTPDKLPADLPFWFE